MVAVGEAAAVVMTGVASWLIGWDGNCVELLGTDACGDGPGTDDDLSSAGLGGSSALTALCWCIFFRLPREGLPCGLLTSDSRADCLGLLLWGGFEADTTAGLDIGFEEGCGGATTSFFTAVGFADDSFTGEVFPLGSSFTRGGLTVVFLSSSGSSKFNARTVDDDRHRSLLVDSCSTGFAVTLAPTVVLAIVVAVVVVEDGELLEAAIVALEGADAVVVVVL